MQVFRRAVITSAAVDDNEIASRKALSQYFEDHPLSDQTVTLTYLRDGLDYDVGDSTGSHYVEQDFPIISDGKKPMLSV